MKRVQKLYLKANHIKCSKKFYAAKRENVPQIAALAQRKGKL
jgi:hypothetical protein